MCDPITIGVMVVTAVSGGMKAYGQYKEGVAQKKYYEGVADQQTEQGRLLYKRGEKQSELGQDSAKYKGIQQKTEAAQVAASQRAAMVANGIDLSSVTSQDLASDTFSRASMDEMAIRYNADINSWNTMEDAKYKKWAQDVNASNSRATGRNALASAKNKATNTLIMTAASVAMGGVSGAASSTSTQGTAGWLNGYTSAAPSNTVNMKSLGYTAFT